jgi:hypothetical protein
MKKLSKITIALAAALIGAYIGFNLAAEVIWCCLLPKTIPDQTVMIEGYDDYGFSSDCMQDCQPINLQGVRLNGGNRVVQNITYSY